MTREELHKYIQISMLLGNIDQETKSVEYNGLYFQEDSYGKIILTQCKGEYEFLNLGNLVDIIGPGIFYLNNTIRELEAPSVTIIKNGAFAYSPLEKINVPTAICAFPKDVLPASRKWIEENYPVVMYTEMKHGGHFTALEQPKEFAENISQFIDVIY